VGQYPASAFPLRFIPDTARRYLYAQETNGQPRLLPDRYEFLVYRLLRNGLTLLVDSGVVEFEDRVY